MLKVRIKSFPTASPRIAPSIAWKDPRYGTVPTVQYTVCTYCTVMCGCTGLKASHPPSQTTTALDARFDRHRATPESEPRMRQRAGSGSHHSISPGDSLTRLGNGPQRPSSAVQDTACMWCTAGHPTAERPSDLSMSHWYPGAQAKASQNDAFIDTLFHSTDVARLSKGGWAPDGREDRG